MFGIVKVIREKQRGFTLIELLVALAILGIIAPVLGLSIFQVLHVNEATGNHMTAVKQVESAVHWISYDSQMAQTVETSGDSGFPLTLSWVKWDNTSNSITYSIETGELERAYSVDGGEPTTTVVARHINTDSEETNCQYDDGVLTLHITASVGAVRPANETRVLEVVPKPQ